MLAFLYLKQANGRQKERAIFRLVLMIPSAYILLYRNYANNRSPSVSITLSLDNHEITGHRINFKSNSILVSRISFNFTAPLADNLQRDIAFKVTGYR